MKDMSAMKAAGLLLGAAIVCVLLISTPTFAAGRSVAEIKAAGELRVQAWIEQDLESPLPLRKSSAASALAALGRPARAAPLLTDPDPSVRTRAACTIVMASRR